MDGEPNRRIYELGWLLNDSHLRWNQYADRTSYGTSNWPTFIVVHGRWFEGNLQEAQYPVYARAHHLSCSLWPTSSALGDGQVLVELSAMYSIFSYLLSPSRKAVTCNIRMHQIYYPHQWCLVTLFVFCQMRLLYFSLFVFGSGCTEWTFALPAFFRLICHVGMLSNWSAQFGKRRDQCINACVIMRYAQEGKRWKKARAADCFVAASIVAD